MVFAIALKSSMKKEKLENQCVFVSQNAKEKWKRLNHLRKEKLIIIFWEMILWNSNCNRGFPSTVRYLPSNSVCRLSHLNTKFETFLIHSFSFSRMNSFSSFYTRIANAECFSPKAQRGAIYERVTVSYTFYCNLL